MSDERPGWFADLVDSYGAVRLGLIALFGPIAAVAALAKGQWRLGFGLGLVWIGICAQVAERWAEDARFSRERVRRSYLSGAPSWLGMRFSGCGTAERLRTAE